jgi:translocation protein SEC72
MAHHHHNHGPQTPLTPVTPIPAELQAIIDQDFIPVPLELSQDNILALCSGHKIEKCDDCQVDFVSLNRLSKLLAGNPNLLCPPPFNIVSQKLTQLVTSIKEDGNVCVQLPFIIGQEFYMFL